MISTDGAGKLPRTVADNVTQGLELLSSTTGIDLAQLLQGITGRSQAAVPAANPTIEIAD